MNQYCINCGPMKKCTCGNPALADLPEEMQRKPTQKGPFTRDHWRYTFAGQIVQGFLINPDSRPSTAGTLFQHSVEAADLLLAELEKGEV